MRELGMALLGAGVVVVLFGLLLAQVVTHVVESLAELVVRT